MEEELNITAESNIIEENNTQESIQDTEQSTAIVTEVSDEEIETLLQDLYKEYMRPLREIIEVFEDFFSEENVDVQRIPTFEQVKDGLQSSALSSLLNVRDVPESIRDKWATPNRRSFRSLSNQEKMTILKLLNTGNRDLLFYKDERFSPAVILVHFPEVRVTNEHGNYTDISHLWAKIEVYVSGRIVAKFKLSKSEYSLLHFVSKYIHSHVPALDYSDVERFMDPCLGEGPIRHTIDSLRSEYSKGLWELFCLELSKYVTVESLEGIPYKALEKLHLSEEVIGAAGYVVWLDISRFNDALESSRWADFIEYLLKSNKLKFSFTNNAYTIGMPFAEYLTTISNEFISWANQLIANKEINHYTNTPFTFKHFTEETGILVPCVITNGQIYKQDSHASLEYINTFIGKPLFGFKGKLVTLNITGLEDIDTGNNCYLLNDRLSLCLLHKILSVLNYRKCITDNYEYIEEKPANFYESIANNDEFQTRKTSIKYF